MLCTCRWEDCGIMYTYLRQYLIEAFVFPRGAPSIPDNRIAEIYTRVSTTSMKESVIKKKFRRASSLRVVFATIAFGMGLDVPDIQRVIHIGPSTDIEDYAQEIGRVGRSRQQAKAILIVNKNPHASKEMKSYIINDWECRRLQIYKQFLKGEAIHSGEPKCSCCDVCSIHCKCGECKDSVYNTAPNTLVNNIDN